MRKTLLYIAFSTLMFSSMEIALKSAGGAFNPIQLNLIRFFIGGVVLLPIALRALHKQHHRLTKSDWGLFFLTGFVCVIISMTLYQLAISVDEASTVAVLFSCNPVFALIFSYLILHERLGRANLIAVIVSIVGLVVIVNPAHLTNPVGLILAIGSALTFGLYSIVSRWGSVRHQFNGIIMTCFTFFAGALELLVVMLVTHIPVVAGGMRQVGWLRQFAALPILQNVSLQYFWILFFIGVCVTGGGFAFYFLAMERSDVSTASLVFFIKPGLAPILAAVLIHEKILTNTIVGIVIILIGSVITFMGNRVKARESALAEEDAREFQEADDEVPAKLAAHSESPID
ncbi:DMT family transporter [Levilactobacillus brevis]|uniref:DMT family transporter n=3 Tax=Levilactobacillus brevis TaxID=1580 RepID=A0AB38X4P2_LEVBR|nr:DMT family transporter [Levilactobacillus brevis]KLE30119.1 membrane protein [Levilactobacillus brevis]MBT9677561.1 EamA family transporter [Levilactobacillus brevis]MCT3569566.1 EamA family transporter [Levilactobacillus brevis]MCT3579512.1 EamA family transporter [Levilactobacillus brevis]MCZ2119794.1 DMT family transporter [Levilactobacillus brevis]